MFYSLSLTDTKEKEKMENMKRFLRMKCKACGHWNRIEVNKLFLEQETSESKVKAYIPMYEPLKTNLEKLKSLLCLSVSYEN